MPPAFSQLIESGSVHNYAKHEDAITNILILNGFTRVIKTGTDKFNTDLLNGEFVEQPNGNVMIALTFLKNFKMVNF